MRRYVVIALLLSFVLGFGVIQAQAPDPEPELGDCGAQNCVYLPNIVTTASPVEFSNLRALSVNDPKCPECPPLMNINGHAQNITDDVIFDVQIQFTYYDKSGDEIPQLTDETSVELVAMFPEEIHEFASPYRLGEQYINDELVEVVDYKVRVLSWLTTYPETYVQLDVSEPEPIYNGDTLEAVEVTIHNNHPFAIKNVYGSFSDRIGNMAYVVIFFSDRMEANEMQRIRTDWIFTPMDDRLFPSIKVHGIMIPAEE